MEYIVSDRVKTLKPSAIREIFKYAADPTVVSLSAGNPAPEAFPIQAIAEISNKILNEEPVAALQYSFTEGYPPLRRTVGEFMKNEYNVGRDFDDLIITSGAQQVMDLITNMETMDSDEFMERYEQLDADAKIAVDDAIREFAANAIGDDHWDSDD